MSSGQKDLKKHPECEIHKRAVGELPSQPSIIASVSNAYLSEEAIQDIVFALPKDSFGWGVVSFQ